MVSSKEKRLRASLAQSLGTEPLLVEVERVIHGTFDIGVQGGYRATLARLLSAGPMLAEAERSALQAPGPARLAEVRNAVQAHLKGPAAIPEQDLAIYIPWLEKDEQGLPTTPPERREDVEGLSRVEQAFSDIAQPRPEVPPPHAPRTLADALPSIAPLDFQQLTPLLQLTAALEAVGLDAEQFGFLLRYGTYAPAGRNSQIAVGGLGLAEFSRRAADWFNALGASKFPIQVIDEGSGELIVYLLEGGPS